MIRSLEFYIIEKIYEHHVSEVVADSEGKVLLFVGYGDANAYINDVLHRVSNQQKYCITSLEMRIS